MGQVRSVIDEIRRQIVQCVKRWIRMVVGTTPERKVVLAVADIEKLERAGDRKSARSLCRRFLEETEPRYQGPLWRFIAEDALYERRDYHGALDAYRKAEENLDDADYLRDLTQPIRVFYGATVANLRVGDREQALHYFDLLTEELARLRKQRWFKGWLRWYDKRLPDLGTRLRAPSIRPLPSLSDRWSHWWIEGDGFCLGVVAGNSPLEVVELVERNRGRFHKITARRARPAVTPGEFERDESHVDQIA
ncbi:MAG: tol-pal system YbgF family protein [Acidobacteriota bacterium]